MTISPKNSDLAPRESLNRTAARSKHRGPNGRIRVLLLTSRFPFPPIGGDKLRIYHIMKHLNRKCNVSLVCFSEQPIAQGILDAYADCYTTIDVVFLSKIRSYISCLRSLFSRRPLQISYYRSRDMARLIDHKRHIDGFDLVFIHLIRMAEYAGNFSAFRILDLTDAQSLNYTRSLPYRRGLWSLINRIEKIRVQHYEQTIWQIFDTNLVVSPVDLGYLRRSAPDMRVQLLQNGVDIEHYPYRLCDKRRARICFVGNMRTFPNADAAIWFAKTVLPVVRSRRPDTQFMIIGTEPSRNVRKLGRIPNVTVTGRVENIADLVHDSAVSVAPMRVGAGIQNKILESMALGTPVVTTSIGLEGIDCTPGKDALVADSAAAFADAVLRLIENQSLRTRISRNARRLIEERYTWPSVLKNLDTFIQTTLRRV